MEQRGDVRTVHIVLLVVLAALIGFSIFGVLVWRAVDTEVVGEEPALSRFQEIRDRYRDRAPMLDLDAAGKVTSAPASKGTIPQPVKQLRVLAYRVKGERLISAEVPFWFVKLKGSAVKFAFRGTGFDLDDLGVTAGDLERHGPGLVLDETDDAGDRLLVWIE